MALDACTIGAHKNKIKTDYTDNLAEEFAKKVGARPRPNETKAEIDERGVFVRQANYFTQAFGDKENELKAEPNRFIIYWAHGCHWSNRPVIVRDILGLDDVIYDRAVTHTGESNKYGWGFGDGKDYKDPVTGLYFLSEAYLNADPNFTGRATTPTLVDVKTKKAVNNDYHRLTNYLEVQFRKYQKTDIDLYPVKYRKEIDEFNDWLFPTINNGHYRMAFCQSYEAYDEAYNDFFDNLEKLDKRLENNRFLFGDYITDSDIRLYVTLVRWETSYYRNVGPIKKRITEYKNIWGYVLDLFSLDVFKKYTFFEFPKLDQDFFKPYAERIAPLIDYKKLWVSDGSRKKLSSDPANVYLHTNISYEDYQTEISVSHWNNKDWKDRNPFNRTISVDPSINPLKGLLKNEK
ncbi:MAG: glutathione S-transferase C-terminal domain-containing protein [Acholeplasmatales bacterium]|nr:glutathione S-transferase C-terminal domain-containing protein [Acholeplasmatales bacterium]